MPPQEEVPPEEDQVGGKETADAMAKARDHPFHGQIQISRDADTVEKSIPGDDDSAQNLKQC